MDKNQDPSAVMFSPLAWQYQTSSPGLDLCPGPRFQAYRCSQSSSQPSETAIFSPSGYHNTISFTYFLVFHFPSRRCDICFLPACNNLENNQSALSRSASTIQLLHKCVPRVTKSCHVSFVTSASSPTSTSRVRSLRMSACSKVFFQTCNPLPLIRMPPDTKLSSHTLSVRQFTWGYNLSGPTEICIS